MKKLARKGSGTAYTALQNRPQPVTRRTKEKTVRKYY